jgi:putative addiction module component (TIGR02574 family)
MGTFSVQTQRQKHLTSGSWLPTLKAVATLPNNISSLTAAEKFELIDALWEDLESHASTLSAEQAEELDRRIAAYEKNPPTGTPWEQVKAGLPKR